MFRCERDLIVMLGRVRERLDAELIAVRSEKTPFKDLAFEVQQRLELPTTADELERVARLLRQRTTVAHRRGVTAARAAGTSVVASEARREHDVDMNNPPLRRRVIEYYGPSSDDLGDPEDLNGTDDDFDDDDDDDQDHDLGDPGDGGPGPGPR